MIRRVLVFAMLLLAASAPSHAAGIAGHLWLSEEVARAHASGSAPSAAARLQQAQAREAVVYVERIPDKVEKKLAKKHGSAKHPPVARVIQQVGQFSPRILAIPAGSSVAFANLDRVYHNAFSVSPAKKFDLGKYPPGRVDTLAFEKAGVVNVHCDIHPEEVGFVVVLPNHEFTRPDSTGAFTLPKLPQGSYTLCAWHPARGERKSSFTVPKHGPASVEVRY